MAAVVTGALVLILGVLAFAVRSPLGEEGGQVVAGVTLVAHPRRLGAAEADQGWVGMLSTGVLEVVGVRHVRGLLPGHGADALAPCSRTSGRRGGCVSSRHAGCGGAGSGGGRGGATGGRRRTGGARRDGGRTGVLPPPVARWAGAVAPARRQARRRAGAIPAGLGRSRQRKAAQDQAGAKDENPPLHQQYLPRGVATSLSASRYTNWRGPPAVTA